MSTNGPQNQDNQEIDLSQIKKKLNGFFEGINRLLFKGIQFFIKNVIVILILVVVGAGIGLFLDQSQKIYDSQIIVTPNFGSTDYLYSKIELLESKIQERDTVFLKKIVGLQNPKEVLKIEIRPITDVYKFIENKAENIELLKLMAEEGDINKILVDGLTSKNYTFHTILLKTKGLTNNEATVQPLLTYLNTSDYFKKMQQIVVKNTENKRDEYDTIIAQINTVLNGFSDKVNGTQKSDKLVYYNENTQLNDIIKTKEDVVKELGILKINLINYDQIIKENSTTLNLKSSNWISGKLKFVLPVLFIFAFIAVHFFIAFYKKQKMKSELASGI
jgi:uncharacterized membrane protein